MSQTTTGEAPLQVRSAAWLGRAVPGLAHLVLADAAVVWAAWAWGWTVMAVVVGCVVDGLADGVFAWLRARASFAAGSATDTRDQVPVSEFIKTYLIVVGVQTVSACMVFAGLLLKPGGTAPADRSPRGGSGPSSPASSSRAPSSSGGTSCTAARRA